MKKIVIVLAAASSMDAAQPSDLRHPPRPHHGGRSDL
jgi:hypothetical protein